MQAKILFSMKLVGQWIVCLCFALISTASFSAEIAKTAAPAAKMTSSVAVNYREGVQYRRLTTPPLPLATGKKVNVVEFFSYGCSHCFAMEPVLDQWLSHSPKNVQFERMPAYWNDYFQLMAQTYYTLVLLKQEKLHNKVFQTIHALGRPLQSPEDVEQFLVEQGIDRAKVHNTLNSFAVQQKIRLSNTTFRGYGLNGVPSFVVGGQYMTDVGMAGSEQNVFKVIEFLVQKIKSGK